MNRKRALAAAAVVLAAACVPATEETDPRGGIGLTLTPSAGSRGEPFVTSDGWNVTVDTLAVQIYFVVVPHDNKEGGFGGMFAFRASKPQSFVVVAIPATTATATLTLTSRFNDDTGPASDFASIPTSGDELASEPELDERFDRGADSDGSRKFFRGGGDAGATDVPPSNRPDDSQPELNYGPSVVIIARGEKAGRVVRLDLTLRDAWNGLSQGVEVAADALTPISYILRAEALFSKKDGTLVFDDIAKADTDHDGSISAAEFRQINLPPCPDCTTRQKQEIEEKARAGLLADVFAERATRLFTP